ncbi:MAG: chemotaxis protein CheB [Leptospirales bacterium]
MKAKGTTQKPKGNPPAQKPGSPKREKKIPEKSLTGIVGIGASAGGLEAFEQFFTHMTSDSGLGFVLVSHLDPGHVSMLTEILQRVTSMPVIEVQNGMKVKPNSVHVIPPNRDMIISQGTLKLSMPSMPRGQRLPIDIFLRSLAKDQGEKAIGIILSGTGTDGTLGLRDIHNIGGLSFVQDPATAKYNGMPSSAIKAGYFSHILPVEKMPETLLEVLHLQTIRHAIPVTQDETIGITQILMLLRSSTGNDFSRYKKSTIGRRIERRMLQNNIEQTELYLRYLKEFPAEVQCLFKELLINVTSFFRDPVAFRVLAESILPKLLEDKPEDYVFRVWVPGCSTGEEVYSIAILLQEFMDKTHQNFKVQIYGTDLDDDAISEARTGVYLPNITQDLSPDRLRRFFIKENTFYRVKKEIRDMVVFAVQNVIKDPPFTKLDILSCRNLLIYLESDLQNRLVLAFHYSLKPGGVLFLSPSESTGNHTDLFTPLSRKWKIYQSVHPADSTHAVMASGLSWTLPSAGKLPEDAMNKVKETNFAELTRRILLHSYAPASVVTDLKGEILFVHGDTGKYLGLSPGHPTMNVVDMARDGLKMELRNAIQSAAKLNEPTLNQELSIKTNDSLQSVSLSVRPIQNSDTNQVLLLITFQDISPPIIDKTVRGKHGTGKIEKHRVEELERGLALAKENLQITIEEQQASNEELKSTNEELQSTNEELQSTNEELETSKEELQSINEELITVNAELQGKIEQLNNMQNDMKNLLDNISVGTIFLDEQMNIRRFSREAGKIYRLIDSDMGRPLADIKSNLLDPDDNLISSAKSVLASLAPIECEVQTVGNNWFLVRIQPYRTLDNIIQGVVMSFTDITQRIKADLLQNERELAEDIVNTVREPLVVMDSSLKIVSASRSFYREFRMKETETIGQPIYQLGNQKQWKLPALKELLENILLYHQSVESYVMEHDFPVLGRRKILLNARRLICKKPENQLILLAIELSDPEKN